MSGKAKNKSLSDLFAGMASGFICGLVYQPLDVIKVNMIILPGSFHYRKRSAYRNFMDMLDHIYEAGGMRAFFRGTTVSLLRASISSGLYFYIMRRMDSRLGNKDRHSKMRNFCNSAFARVFVGFLLNPLGILKTRAQIIDDVEYAKFKDGIVKVFRKEKLQAFTKGGLSMLLEEFPFGGIFNLSYEYINEKGQFREKKNKLGLLMSAVVSGIIASTLTHPAEIVRTKVQAQKVDWTLKKHNSIILSILADAYEKWGFVGLFRGLQPRLIKKTLVTATNFFFYELFIQKTQKIK